MHRQYIYASPSWKHLKASRFDCVFIEKDSDLLGIHGLYIAQVVLLFHSSIEVLSTLVL
jgi:hypothetical protein